MAKEKEIPASLEDYIKSLSKEIRSAQSHFWKETKAAEEGFHKAMVAAMRDFEKVAYSKKRVRGALAGASKNFNDQYDIAREAFGNATKEALEGFAKKMEDLIGI
jgi:flagellar biosynthesis/type III secretory pathway protein FliH